MRRRQHSTSTHLSGKRVNQDLVEISARFRLPMQWDVIDIYKPQVFNDLARWPNSRENTTAVEETLYEENIDIVFSRFGFLDECRLVASAEL